MLIDFTSMDGYEFEDFISGLFRRLGFEVEVTNYSNDGGVDLVATFNQPIFSGKYIIQCKNWTGPVGQPEVRDLYGVVMDQRANKGILITPSDYTQQAYDFARGKNIELINGIVLRELISSENAIEKEKDLVKTNSFQNNRYQYYQKNIENEPKNVQNYLQMIDFLREFAKTQDAEACAIELFDEIIDWTNKLINRCYKAASKTEDRGMALLLQVEALIHVGRLAEATEILLKCNKFWINDFTYNGYQTDKEGVGYYYQHVISWNLYAAFNHINYKRGCELLISKLDVTDNPFLPSGLQRKYYNNGFLGCRFVYPRPIIRVKRLDVTLFFENDFRDPTFFFARFFKKSSDEYAKEIDEVFKLHGLI